MQISILETFSVFQIFQQYFEKLLYYQYKVLKPEHR